MKNIHVLPTPNESRLYYNSQEKAYQLCEFPKYHTDIKSTHNIYITSDEEIKVDEYYIHGNRLHKHLGKKCLDVLTNKEYPQSNLINKDSVFKKVILSTDQDLIKDGVQSIDDEFLEWFVKNPSCEEVEVVYGLYNLMGRKISIEKVGENNSQCVWKHKIITTKEEPKQETWEERKWLEIFREYTKYKKSNLFMFFDWLETNYNPPTKK